MTFRVGSTVRVSDEDAVQRVTRLDDHDGRPSAWYQAMIDEKPEKGSVPVSILRTGIVLRGR